MYHEEAETAWRGEYVTMMRNGRWEYATRTNARTAVGLVPVTDAGELVVIEQYRPPVKAHVVELPAGLVGDVAGRENEDLRAAARRELLEETGYAADTVEELFFGASTPGLADETVTFFLATGLRRETAGGGDESENIVVRHVPLPKVHTWLTERIAAGMLVDLKLYTGLYFLHHRGL